MPFYALKELAAAGVAVLDCEHRTPSSQATGYPYIAIPDVVGGRVELNGARRISQEDLRDWNRRTVPQGGDVLVTRRGRVGDTAVIADGLECAIGQNLVLLRSDGTEVQQDFLRWAARSPQWWSEVDRLRNVGAVFSSLNVRDIARIRIPVPSKPEQRGIAKVLGALDDKITANTKLVESADALSAATFASMLAEKDSMPLTAVASFINGKAFTKNATGIGRVVIRIAELNSGIGGSTVYNDLDVPEQNLAKPGDLLFAWSGSLTLHRWYRPEGIVNQHIFKVIPNSGYPMWCVHGLIARKLDEFKSIAADKATTMGHIQRRHLDEPVNVPSQSRIKNHDVFMSALWECALAAEQESLTLEATRDALLPQLMSGNIRVKDVEKTVGKVL
jgi:type I restriction enzyme S subunit